MRISDWSSDVCSNDERVGQAEIDRLGQAERCAVEIKILGIGAKQHQCRQTCRTDGVAFRHCLRGVANGVQSISARAHVILKPRHFSDAASVRSEEHTSELLSLMRTSYAVFC